MKIQAEKSLHCRFNPKCLNVKSLFEDIDEYTHTLTCDNETCERCDGDNFYSHETSQII